MSASDDWRALIPHAGRMCLLDTLVSRDGEALHARAHDVGGAGHPLCRQGRLHALHLAEYGAQAAAVHAALTRRDTGDDAPRGGMIVGLRDVRLAVEFVDDGAELDVHAVCLAADAAAAQYGFRVEQAGRTLAEGRCLVAYGS